MTKEEAERQVSEMSRQQLALLLETFAVTFDEMGAMMQAVGIREAVKRLTPELN